jgi:signal peptidase I
MATLKNNVAKNGSASRNNKIKKDSWLRSLFVAALIAGVIRTSIAGSFRIPSGSMKNTVLVGDHIFVNQLAYFIQTPKYVPFTSIGIPHLHIKTWDVVRGDVVVFEYPGDRDEVVPHTRNEDYIKRCVGLPGDVIQIRNKQLYVNGTVFPNPPEAIFQTDTERAGLVDSRIFPRGAQWNTDNYGPLRIPKTGDVIPINKDNIDAWQVFIEREGHHVELGFDDQILIDGKSAIEYKVQRDYLWMMGDNRDNSEDSRIWGFAPMDNIVGKGGVVYWSWYNPPSSGQGDDYDPDEVQKFHIRWDRIGTVIN